MEKYIQQAISMAIEYAPKVLLAIITLVVGFWIIGVVVKLFKKSLKKSSLDDTLRNFLGSVTSIILKVALLISVASIVGIETTSFVALIGVAGLAIGMALQGSLSNLAGGVLIMLFKPFKIGDFIQAQGFSGSVEDIQMFHTILKTGDNKTIIIANGPLAGGSVTNFSTKPTRRVDMVFGIGYNDDIDHAKKVLHQLVDADSRIMQDPAPFLVVSELAESSVNLALRVWCKSGDYWGIFFDMQENVKKTFDKEGISIPFPQRDIHMYETK